MTYRASGIRVLMLRGMRINLLLTLEISKRLPFHTDLRDRAVATRAKAKISCPGVENTLRHLASQSKERVSIATILDTFNGIAHGGKDPKVMGHLSPNHRWNELGFPVKQDGGYASTANSPDI